MDCLVQHPQSFWTGVMPHHGLTYHQRNYFSNFYFPRKRPYGSSFFPGSSLFFSSDDDVDYPTDFKGDSTTPSYTCLMDDTKVCVVCGERASGYYFGALVCLPCKSFYIRCTKDGEPTFTCQCSGNCDIAKQGRIRCQYCRYQRCLMAGMCRKEKPETVQPAEGQVLCKVCGDIANGIHFGVNTCEGCKKFFRRGLVENQSYVCKGEKTCGINPRNRNNCRYCRYQKCLGVGMSREAIKMGRPKKCDATECCVSSPKNDLMNHGSPQNLTGNLSPNHSDSNTTPPPMTNPSPISSSTSYGEREANHDTLKGCSPLASNPQIKVEVDLNNCEYDPINNHGSGPNHSPHHRNHCEGWVPPVSPEHRMNWHQSHGQLPSNGSHPRPHPPTSCYGSTSQSGNMTATSSSSTSQAMPSEFSEQEMDEILLLLQNDNHPQQVEDTDNWVPVKRRRCTYTLLEPQQNLKTEHSSSAQNQCIDQAWNIHHQTVVAGSPVHQPSFHQHMDQRVGMSSHPSPPQYPGYKAADMSPRNTSCTNYPMSSEPHIRLDVSCNSPANSSPHSPCSSVGSPAMMHSPNYQSDHSPVHSPANQSYSSPPHINTYDCNASPVGSSFDEEQQQYSPNHQPYCHSPAYPSQGSPSCMQQPHQSPCHYSSSPNHSMGSPCMQQSPDSGYCQPNSPAENTYSPYLNSDNLNKVTHFFLNSGNMDHCYIEDEIVDDGSLTRNEIEREIVLTTLSSINPTEVCYYRKLQADMRRSNKRKSTDDCAMNGHCVSNTRNLSQGCYCPRLSQGYWSSFHNQEGCKMTEEKKALLDHVRQLYMQMVEATDEVMLKRDQGSLSPQHWPRTCSQWSFIQKRIVRNAKEAVKFATQLPGFNNIHPDDKALLCQNVGFMASVMVAGAEWYDPVEKCFKNAWNWKVGPDHPFYCFKQRLLEMGELVNGLQMDTFETAMLTALLFLGTDWQDLVYPEALEGPKDQVIAALQAYEAAKGGDSGSRLTTLFQAIPQIRHIGMWHQEMTRHMRININTQELHQLVNNTQ